MADLASGRPAGTLPEPVAYVRNQLLGFAAPWVLCGGWSVDAWLGRQTRPHGDVDIAVFHHDQHAIFEHFPGWAMVGHDPNVPDDTTEQWNGRRLDPPAHIHVPRLGSSLSTSAALTHTAFEFEFLLVERSDDEWVLRREPKLTLPLDRCVRPSWSGLPTIAPEVALFYKAGGHLTVEEAETQGDVLRPQDEQDRHVLLATLGPAQRAWLAESLAGVRPGHPWLTHLVR